jgi:hypothetical protein
MAEIAREVLYSPKILARSQAARLLGLPTRACAASLIGTRTLDLDLTITTLALRSLPLLSSDLAIVQLDVTTWRSGAERTGLAYHDLLGRHRPRKYMLRAGSCAGARVTWCGRFPRKYGMDELPAPSNVIRDGAPSRQVMPPGRSRVRHASGRVERVCSDKTRPDREHILRGSFKMNIGVMSRTLSAAARGSAPTQVKAE